MGWKVVHKVLKPIRRNVKTSLVEVFASFICSRLLLTSMYILILCTVYTYNPESDRLTKEHFIINSPTVEYFGRQHLPFALMVIVLSTMFFTVPMFYSFCILSRNVKVFSIGLDVTLLFCIKFSRQLQRWKQWYKGLSVVFRLYSPLSFDDVPFLCVNQVKIFLPHYLFVGHYLSHLTFNR